MAVLPGKLSLFENSCQISCIAGISQVPSRPVREWQQCLLNMGTPSQDVRHLADDVFALIFLCDFFIFEFQRICSLGSIKK